MTWLEKPTAAEWRVVGAALAVSLGVFLLFEYFGIPLLFFMIGVGLFPVFPGLLRRTMQPSAGSATPQRFTVFWTRRSVPELRELPPEERARVWKATLLKPLRHWQCWAMMAAFMAAIYATLGWDAPGSGPAGSVLAGLIGGAGGLGVYQVAMDLKRPYMRASVAEGGRQPKGT